MTEFNAYLQSHPLVLIALMSGVGLVAGGVLNVVIVRLPRLLEAQWREESMATLEIELADPQGNELAASAPVSLLTPSCCPACRAPIRPSQNIPVLSWLALRGKCANCRAPISIQYPLVELISAVAAAVCAWRFGWSLQLAPALVLSWVLIALTVIDLREMLLPDDLTLPLLWFGLALSTLPVFVGMSASIWGGIAGYLSLWTIYHLFRLATGKEGMGYGDFKLLAALGAWFGAGALPMILLLSSVVGAVVGIGMIVLRGRDRSLPIPFGPYLAGAGWLTLIWGDQLKPLIMGF